MHHLRSSIHGRGRHIVCQLFMLCCFMFFMAAEGVAETRLPASEPGSSISDSSLSPQSPKTPLKLYFYNPEINASRNLVLKNAWDTFLADHGHFIFQPVDGREDFRRLLQEEQDAAFIMSEWFFKNLEIDQALFTVAMQGLKDGQDTYRRILVGYSSSIDIDKARIAFSGNKTRTLKILREMFPELSGLQLSQLKLLEVPKDIDALMALGYGLADLALSSEVSLANMAKLNQNRFQALHALKESKPIGQSILVFSLNNASLKEQLARGLMLMPESDSGRRAISMIGLDNWKILDSELGSQLNRTMVSSESLAAETSVQPASDTSKKGTDTPSHNGGQN